MPVGHLYVKFGKAPIPIKEGDLDDMKCSATISSENN